MERTQTKGILESVRLPFTREAEVKACTAMRACIFTADFIEKVYGVKRVDWSSEVNKNSFLRNQSALWMQQNFGYQNLEEAQEAITLGIPLVTLLESEAFAKFEALDKDYAKDLKGIAWKTKPQEKLDTISSFYYAISRYIAATKLTLDTLFPEFAINTTTPTNEIETSDKTNGAENEEWVEDQISSSPDIDKVIEEFGSIDSVHLQWATYIEKLYQLTEENPSASQEMLIAQLGIPSEAVNSFLHEFRKFLARRILAQYSDEEELPNEELETTLLTPDKMPETKPQPRLNFLERFKTFKDYLLRQEIGLDRIVYSMSTILSEHYLEVAKYMHLLGLFYPQEDSYSYVSNQHNRQELYTQWNLHMLDTLQAAITTNMTFPGYSLAQLNHDLATSTQQRGLDKNRISFPRTTTEKVERILSWFDEQEAQGNDPMLILNIPKKFRHVWPEIKKMYTSGHVSTWNLGSLLPNTDRYRAQTTINNHIQYILIKISSEQYSKYNVAYNAIIKTLRQNPILLNRLNETEKKLLESMQQQWETDRILVPILRSLISSPRADINYRLQQIREKLQTKPSTAGKVLKILRESRGLSETELGDILGLTHQAISHTELNPSTRIDTLVKFLRACAKVLNTKERNTFLIYACIEILQIKTSDPSITTAELPDTDSMVDTITGIHRKFGLDNAFLKYLTSKAKGHNLSKFYNEITKLRNSRLFVDEFVDLLKNVGLEIDSYEAIVASLLLLEEKGIYQF